MTQATTKRTRRLGYIRLGVLAALLLCILFSSPIAEGVRRGLRLCAEAVIPSVLPSMLLSDLFLYAASLSTSDRHGRLFSRIFRLPPIAATAYATGLLTGFPLGVRMTVSLYREGALTKEEAERFLAFVGNTGPAFLIAGIGAGLLGRPLLGVLFYLLQLLTSLGIGWWVGRAHKARHTAHTGAPIPFSFSDSVRSVGEHTVTLCTFVCLFSALSEVLMRLIAREGVLLFLLPFLEISTACAYLSAHTASGAAIPLMAFAIGFSGISVHAQSVAFLSKTDLNSRQYFAGKTAQGVLCGLLCALLCACF